MSCHACKHVGRSYDGNPFAPPGHDCHARMFACSTCGARWHQYNDHFHLWRDLPKDAIVSLIITDDNIVLADADDARPDYPD